MYFKIKVTDGDESWWESYNTKKDSFPIAILSCDNPDEWGKLLIEWFNNSLRPHEKSRSLLEAKEMTIRERCKHEGIEVEGDFKCT